MLELYVPKARVVLIYNQQWIGSPKTERLLDLGRERYLASTPFAAMEREAAEKAVAEIYRRREEPHSNFGGKKRGDTPDIWQWIPTRSATPAVL